MILKSQAVSCLGLDIAILIDLSPLRKSDKYQSVLFTWRGLGHRCLEHQNAYGYREQNSGHPSPGQMWIESQAVTTPVLNENS